jgi:hypothetical protein
MGIGRIIFAYILKLRGVFQAVGAKLFARTLDPETGKFKHMSGPSARRLAYVFLGVFFAIILVSQLLNRDGFASHSFDDYQKELHSDGGTHARDTGRALFDKDPLGATVRSNQSDTYGDLQPNTTVSPVDMFNHGTKSAANDPTAVAIPAASECFAVIEKAKAGSALTSVERSRVTSCIANTVVPVSDADKSILRALAASDLSPAERQAVLSTMKGDGTEKGQQLSEVISASLDPSKQEVIKEGVNKEFSGQGVEIAQDEVRGLSKTMAEKPNDFEQAIGGTTKILAGNSPDSGEKSNLIDAIRSLKGGENAAMDNPNLSSDKEKALETLITDIQGRDEKITDLKQKLAEAQADARVAADKIAKGEALTNEEQASLDKMSSLRKEETALASLQEKRQRTLIELTSRLQKTVAAAEASIQKTIPTGVFEGYADYQPLDCKTIKPLVKIGRKSPAKDGRVASNKSSRELSLKPKVAFNVYRIEDEIGKSSVQPDGKRLDINQYMQQNIAIADLFIVKGGGDKGVFISPETKIAAMLDSEILVSSNGGGQVVRIKIVQDVFDAKDRRLIIPKGSVATGRANNFDDNTGVMDLLLDKVSTGSGNMVAVQLRVGSGDGTIGLKGQIRDTQGRYLLGAFITSFTAGALDFFTQNTLSAYQQSAVASTALTGAAFGGGADVATKIAALEAGKLANAAKIFYSPKGLPIVLYPEAQ